MKKDDIKQSVDLLKEIFTELLSSCKAKILVDLIPEET